MQFSQVIESDNYCTFIIGILMFHITYAEYPLKVIGVDASNRHYQIDLEGQHHPLGIA